MELLQPSSLAEIDGGLVHHRLGPRHFVLRHPRSDQRSSTAHALDHDLGVFLADAGIGQRTKQAASHAADRHTAQQRSKPSGADDSADTGYSEHGDEAGCRRRCCADRSTKDRSLALAMGIAARAILPHGDNARVLRGAVPGVGIV